MEITDIKIRSCRHAVEDETYNLKDGSGINFEFLVMTFETNEGISVDTFGFCGRDSEGIGAIAENVIKPFFIGRDPLYREKHWHEFRKYDRAWHLTPIYSYAPFDIACALIASVKAGLPLYKYLGAYRDQVPLYGSSLTLDTPEAYAEEAKAVKDKGWAAYKLHPPADYELGLAAHRLCREAVGPNFKLMSDPVGSYTSDQCLRFGRELEKLDYYWLEEPLYDETPSALRELTRKLDIPVVGGETLAKRPYSAAEYVSTRVIDILRADVSWCGGITGTIKTAHLAEAFGMQCEIHTAIFHPLELVNLHVCAAIKNSEFFELLVPEHLFNIGLKEDIRIEDGMAHLPEASGLGIDLDWDFIENNTLRVF
jgi:L-alanine-DL-glutamate epimerase-like enolase superfamily enzyme